MIDIHSHILPGVDDGAPDLRTARAMAERYRGAGVDEVICTPHLNAEMQGGARLREAFASFREAVSNIPVRFYLGAEIYYYPGMTEDLSAGRLFCLGGSRAVLIEFSTRQETDIADIVYDVSVAGFRPVVAHIERYWYLKKDDYFLIRESGGMIQINAGVFAHEHAVKTAKFLLKEGLVDAIASDAHDDSLRPVDFSLAQKCVKRKFPRRYSALFENSFETLFGKSHDPALPPVMSGCHQKA